MAKKGEESKSTRTPIDTSGIFFEEGVEIPPQVKESKYPWAQLVGANGASFFVPIGSEAEASLARVSIQSSGRNYYTKRGLPYKSVCRAMQGPDGKTWGVRAWAKFEAEEEAVAE